LNIIVTYTLCKKFDSIRSILREEIDFEIFLIPEVKNFKVQKMLPNDFR